MTSSSKPKKTKEIPKWLFALLEAKFFTTRGSNRDETNFGFFCLDCLGNALRKVDMIHHSGHEILQIVKSSHEYAIKVHDINNRVIDCEKIHRFQVNGSEIFFLHSKKPKFYNGRVEFGCKVCNHSLKKGSDYCSLACKFKKAGGIVEKKDENVLKELDDHQVKKDENVIDDHQIKVIENGTKDEIVVERGAKRRKGIPRRGASYFGYVP